MKLRYSSTSPFVRKVSIVAIETGLDARIEREAADVWAPDTDIGKDNPLGKVPALITDGGETLIDSSLICEYLDSLHNGKKLIPSSGGERWAALNLQAMGDGVAETGIRRLLEQRQGGGSPRQGWIDRQNMVIGRILKTLEEDADSWSGKFGIGQIAVVSAMGWLEFRGMKEPDFDAKFPKLAAWLAEVSKRPSVASTEPREQGGR